MAGPKKGGEEKKSPGSEKLMVAVRIRPLSNDERMRGAYRITQYIDKQMMILEEAASDKNDPLRQNRTADKKFMFDRLFSEDANQKEVYEDTTKPLVQDVLDGYSATVFAYGPTGAGKTFTMVGTQDHPGIMVRALNELFTLLGDNLSKTKISMSYLEIYNENIRDLLTPSGTLDLREDAKTGVIQVAGLSEKSIVSTKEVMVLLTKGNKERTCEPTAANKTSSRSHALLQVTVRRSSIKSEGEEIKIGRLFMVDLAGSERAKQTKNKGKRLQEGAHINRSLLALGNCINALAEGRAKYVNYRDSKLTRLLKDALSGNCRTAMVAHVSPCHQHREETRNTLIYADRAKNISKNIRNNVLTVSHHILEYKKIITELTDEVTRLKGKISEGGGSGNAKNGDCVEVATSQEEQKKNAEKMKKLKNDLVEHFREQMSLRSKIMDIDSNILALSMEFERQNLVVREWEAERARRSRIKLQDEEIIVDHVDTDKERDDDSDDEDEPEEVTQAWEDLMYLQKEQQRYTDMRLKVEQEMMGVKKRAKEMEEALPKTITTDEQRELLGLLCKVHELEIEKMEMESVALVKEHELRRRDMVIMRYDRQRNLCEEIITRQRQMIEALSPGMPPELQELYELYQMEVQYSGDRDANNLLDPNSMRSPSMLSVRAFDKLPPINSREPEKLFDRPTRRHSLGDVRRPESALSLRSPTSSASSSVSGSRVPALPPIRGARDRYSRRRESKGQLGSDRHSSLEGLDSPGLPGTDSRRRSLVSDDNISVLSLRLDSPPRKARSRARDPLPRRHPHHNQQQQQQQQQQQGAQRRRRIGSASSSDGDSPVHRHSNKYHRNDQPSRRRGAAGVPRRQSIPPPTRRAIPTKPPDPLEHVAFALNR